MFQALIEALDRPNRSSGSLVMVTDSSTSASCICLCDPKSWHYDDTRIWHERGTLRRRRRLRMAPPPAATTTVNRALQQLQQLQ